MHHTNQHIIIFFFFIARESKNESPRFGEDDQNHNSEQLLLFLLEIVLLDNGLRCFSKRTLEIERWPTIAYLYFVCIGGIMKMYDMSQHN